MLEKNFVGEFSNEIVEDMMQRMQREMISEAAEELQRLNDLAHKKTEDCFKGVYGLGNVQKKLA